jgi:hypothetical protein
VSKEIFGTPILFEEATIKSAQRKRNDKARLIGELLSQLLPECQVEVRAIDLSGGRRDALYYFSKKHEISNSNIGNRLPEKIIFPEDRRDVFPIQLGGVSQNELSDFDLEINRAIKQETKRFRF